MLKADWHVLRKLFRHKFVHFISLPMSSTVQRFAVSKWNIIISKHTEYNDYAILTGLELMCCKHGTSI